MKKVLFVPGSLSASAHYRVLNPMRYFMMNQDLGVFPMYLGPTCASFRLADVVYSSRLTRQLAELDLSKLVVDYDDCLWRPGPSYNRAFDSTDVDVNREYLAKYLPQCRGVTCSTEFLRKQILEDFGVDATVIPNFLPNRDWAFPMASNVIYDDGFLFAGSPTHFRNGYGDFGRELATFLKTRRCIVMGDEVPQFLAGAEKVPWSSIEQYHQSFYNASRLARFIVAPLVDNDFNRAKSDLKYLECAAVGRVALVSDFEGSPYSGAHTMQKIPVGATVDDIAKIISGCYKHYGEILEHQREYLAGRWLELNMPMIARVLKGE